MKRIQRTAALLLALLMILAACSTAALAATNYKVITLKKGTWIKLPYGNTDKIYKLVLSSDSIVTVNWKDNKNDYGYAYLYPDTKCEESITDLIDYEGAAGTRFVALSKGTYYIRMYDYAEKPTTQIKVTVQKAINKANYCRAKAIALKPNVTVKIAQTPDYNYDRWYKITLSKKKTVTITTNDEMADCIRLYDSKMREVECTSGSRKVITEDPIAKGTYFIRVSCGSYYNSEYLGRYITMKWN